MTTECDALIIGAGFSGLYQLHLLRDRLGLKVRVLEAGDGVGGAWYWNRYPGARCDTESHAYAFFFSRELHESWQWSERYPGQEEIRAYLNHVADGLDLRQDIELGARVTGAAFDEGANRWSVETGDGRRYGAKWLIAAVGCLSSANIPAIPGLGDFAGRWYHTGQWPHEGVDFSGKRVAQIGTGSTGIQAAPVIAETAGHLTMFQRTANHSAPARNAPLSEETKREVREGYDEIRELTRSTPNGHPFRISERRALSVDEAERRALYEKAWEVGGLRFRTVFGDLLQNKDANETAAEFIKAKIREVVKDPETAEMLADIDHPYAAKRPPIDTHYFETFNRPNVSLVNVRSDPIKRIVPQGIEMTSGAVHEVDVIVFATGFDALTGPLTSIDFRGRDGISLAEAWKDGASTYLGLQVAGFPNLFTMTGPGSPSVLCNMPVAIEQHAEWIANCIARMRDQGAEAIETTPEAADAWMARCDKEANATLLPTVPHSWYMGANVPGKPKRFLPYAGGMTRYRAICDEVAAEDHAGFVVDGVAARNEARAPEAALEDALSPGV